MPRQNGICLTGRPQGQALSGDELGPGRSRLHGRASLPGP
ncbi:hypothetical protein DESPIGER_1353 [Desulfovibrio piger]|uniref:Uncharacterized protein n=1 Tax=Desulfovibrio piger TaxID=901 RepID=A0A1K1LER4_9BACT|nr:hypothetical protein DESPIGER_1353 [Desulfovibrio piger]